MTLLGLLAAGARARAEDGYFSGTLGARAAGRAGAFVAKADDITAVSVNPAGLAKLASLANPNGTLVQLGNQLSHNAYAFTRAPTLDYGHLQNGQPPLVTFDRARNARPWQALDPFIGVASNLGLKDWGFALSAFAPPGVGRQSFPVSGGQRYMMVDREAVILTYAASVAWKHREDFGVGATLEWIHVPRLKYSLVIDGSPFSMAANPVSSDLDMLATNQGSSLFTFNAVLGAWYRPTPSWELALSGQVIPTDIVIHSKLSVSAINADLGAVTLTRNDVPANDVTLTLPLPMRARAGGRYRHLVANREVFDVELDVEYATWSRAQSFVVDTRGLNANFSGPNIGPQVLPLGRIVIDKHWSNTLAFRLGGDYAAVPGRLTLRAGAAYETAVAPAAYSNVDFPGGSQVTGSVGTSFFFGRWELALAYFLRVQPSVQLAEADARVYQTVPGSQCVPPYADTQRCSPYYLGQPAPAVNAGTYVASSHVVLVDVLYRFGL